MPGRGVGSESGSALGSTDEVGAVLDQALVWGYVTEKDLTEARPVIDREARLLRGLTKKEK